MFVRKIETLGGGIVEVGQKGVQRIDIDKKEMIAYIYSFGGNIYQKKVGKILKNDKCVSNSKNAYKNIY